MRALRGQTEAEQTYRRFGKSDEEVLRDSFHELLDGRLQDVET